MKYIKIIIFLIIALCFASCIDNKPDAIVIIDENQPIGLWTLKHLRKQAYAGFANGLAGRDISADK